MREILEDREFWELFSELVATVYATEKRERLGIVVPYLEEIYGPTNSRLYEQVEGTVLRAVMLLEGWPPGPDGE